jgi:pimeloyl-ACP methyl ester carboxylesterase
MVGGAHQVIDSSDGVRIVLHDLGGPSGGVPGTPVLLFSHATGFHGRVWEPMASLLADQFRCVSLDLRGHGASDLAPGATLAWSGMADDVVAALESGSLPAGPIHGIGHSMGGAVLVLAAARRPDAFRSLWLYEPVIIPAEGEALPVGGNPMSDAAARRRDRFDSLDQAYENYRSKPPLNQLHPDALRAYVDGGFSHTSDGSVVLRCRPSTEAEVFRQAASSGAWGVLTSVRIPVAVVAGRHDEAGPAAFAGAAAETLPEGSLALEPDLGHFGPLEDPAALAEEVATWVRAHT